MALKEETFRYISKAFSPDTPQRTKRQNKGPKKHDGKYAPSCGSKGYYCYFCLESKIEKQLLTESL